MNKVISIVNIILLVFTCCNCKNLTESDQPIYIDNNSQFTISSYIPLIGMEGAIYPDTILTMFKQNIGYSTLPQKRAYAGISNISIVKWISSFPKDTVSIFIFNKDTLDTYPWNVIQQDYKILQRYDLSLEDFKTLENKDGVPVLTYPPNEKMEKMKMYPPYHLDWMDSCLKKTH